jgi:NADH-quinone oxidoreductase subunit A
MPADFDFRWTAVILSGVVGCLAIGLMFAASMFISSRRHSEIKLSSYECGIPAGPFQWSQINIRYYIFAILFLIFDVEAVFLFPWAVIFMGNNVAFYAMMMFLAVLGFSILYGWRKGVLQWWR